MTETTVSDSRPARSSLARRWLIRMLGITFALLAFGLWGFYDATAAYPNRGIKFAEHMQWQYLSQAESSGRIFSAAIADPVTDLEALRERDAAGIRSGIPADFSEFERAKYEWLKAVAIPGVGLLTPEHTNMADPRAELERLASELSTSSPPKPLSEYDILVQWLICVVSWAAALWLIVMILRVRSRVYAWNSATLTLTLPGGKTVGPDDLDPAEPVDLSKWRKFIILLLPKDGHETLSGPIRFDVFRHEPLEDWLRTIAKAANPEIEFPDEREAREAAEAEASASESDAEDGAEATGESSQEPEGTPPESETPRNP